MARLTHTRMYTHKYSPVRVRERTAGHKRSCLHSHTVSHTWRHPFSGSHTYTHPQVPEHTHSEVHTHHTNTCTHAPHSSCHPYIRETGSGGALAPVIPELSFSHWSQGALHQVCNHNCLARAASTGQPWPCTLLHFRTLDHTRFLSGIRLDVLGVQGWLWPETLWAQVLHLPSS